MSYPPLVPNVCVWCGKPAKSSKEPRAFRACNECCPPYQNSCFWCGKKGKLTKDHLVPRAHGGKSGIKNIVHACKECNGNRSRLTTLHLLLVRAAVSKIFAKHWAKLRAEFMPLIQFFLPLIDQKVANPDIRKRVRKELEDLLAFDPDLVTEEKWHEVRKQLAKVARPCMEGCGNVARKGNHRCGPCIRTNNLARKLNKQMKQGPYAGMEGLLGKEIDLGNKV